MLKHRPRSSTTRNPLRKRRSNYHLPRLSIRILTTYDPKSLMTVKSKPVSREKPQYGFESTVESGYDEEYYEDEDEEFEEELAKLDEEPDYECDV
jgi:hypothetical protein